MPEQASDTVLPAILSGQKALIVGVANDRSIAWGCAASYALALAPRSR